MRNKAGGTMCTPATTGRHTLCSPEGMVNMLLALSTIADRLPQDFGVKLYGMPEKPEFFPRPVLYEADMTFEAGTLYIARGNSLPDQAPSCDCAIICVGSTAPWQRKGARVSLLHVSRESNLVIVFNAVQGIYNDCDVWDTQLRDEVEKDLDFDIDAVLVRASAFLERSLCIVDQHLQVVRSTAFEFDADGKPAVTVDDTMTNLSTELPVQVKEVCRLERMIREPYFSALRSPESSYCNNLYPLGYFAGCISISENGVPFRDGELPLIDHFFALFQKAFLKYLRSYANNADSGLDALRNVLDHKPLSRHETELLALAPDEQWCCFKLRKRRVGQSLPSDYLHATLSGRFPGVVYAVVFKQAVVGIVRVPKSTDLAIDPQFVELGREVERMGYYGGVSNAFSELTDIDQHLLQAEFAAARGRDEARALFFFHDYALSYLLDACCAEMPVEAVMGQGLKNLRAYDQAKGSEHVHTLELYLRNECNVTRTAHDLHIHRSSLLKRLDKIKAMLDDDLEDPNHRLYYRLCLTLMNHEPTQV